MRAQKSDGNIERLGHILAEALEFDRQTLLEFQDWLRNFAEGSLTDLDQESLLAMAGAEVIDRMVAEESRHQRGHSPKRLSALLKETVLGLAEESADVHPVLQMVGG